jgi:hypothetical protein
MTPSKVYSYAVAAVLLGSPSLFGEIPAAALHSEVDILIKSQIGESGAWDDSLSGGYLFRFSADLFGDASQEDFLASSRSFLPDAGWMAFSNGQRIGWLDLSAFEFLLIREGETSIFPSWSSTGGHTGMLVQTWDPTGIKQQSREVHQEELGTLIQDWKARGQVIRPQLEMLRLVDYLQGKREWEPVDLSVEEVEFRGNTRSIVLKRDLERLQTLNLRPEQALEMFNRIPKPTPDVPSKPSLTSQSKAAAGSRSTESHESIASPAEPPSTVWLPRILIGIASLALIIVVLLLRRRV